ncbi:MULTISPECIES: cardiolipin synthase ClsB [unclassified Massilia]|uniref:cardiolipin synthase ClsB n=1 Tax=unclassified Massilia TaxID=2609279 RepID=UPI0017868C9C|nr:MULTISPECIES: cardiolipin synthase ClsB [unclassified Massilia]MBD8529682.1 cardiolipin synthase ClsB [Massilia sp. CFBP 13647]MBD8673231.1 cardiolipin synthase ClsB [Massilia sp. CFBP 13721]
MRSVTYVANNDIVLLETGQQLFPAMIAAIDAAQHEVLFETYIFAEDEVARGIEAALIRAAGRGVKVRVLVDWFGTGHRTCCRRAEAFATAGVHYRVFNPWFKRGIARTHRKITVVDAEVAFVGGININDDMKHDYEPYLPLPAPRWDFAVRVRGPLVAHIHFEARAQWMRAGRLDLLSRIGLYRETRRPPPTEGARPMRAAFVVRDNLRNRRTIQRAYLQAIGQARKSVLLANPYFAPGRKFREALARAARRGVQVTLLIGVGEFRMQDAVARSFYPKLLAAGIQVVEYRKTQLHAKIAVVDDDWSTVGSSNCDGLSLFLNQEANIVVRNTAFARAVRAHIERGIADGEVVRMEDFEGIGWVRRVRYEMAYLLYKLTMRIFAIGYA